MQPLPWECLLVADGWLQDCDADFVSCKSNEIWSLHADENSYFSKGRQIKSHHGLHIWRIRRRSTNEYRIIPYFAGKTPIRPYFAGKTPIRPCPALRSGDIWRETHINSFENVDSDKLIVTSIIRKRAIHALHNHDKYDSYGVCFVGHLTYWVVLPVL